MIPVVTLGETLIDMIPVDGGASLAQAETFSRQPGGAPANVAVQVAKLGGRSVFIGKVGEDAFGRFLEETLRQSGVDTRHMQKTKEANTALAFVSKVEDDECPFTFYRNLAADQLLTPGEVPTDRLTAPGIFHFGSVSLTAEPARSATRFAVESARKQGMLVSFDPNIRPPLWPSAEQAKREIWELLPLSHVVKISRSELAFLTEGVEGSPEQKAKHLLDVCSLSLLVVSLSSQGCRYVTRHGSGTVPAPAVDAVDPTGAGDSLTGALLYRLAEEAITPRQLDRYTADPGWVEKHLRFAATVAAHSTVNPGAISSYIGREQLSQLGLETL